LLGTLSENPGLEVGPQPVQDEDSISAGAMSFSLGSISMGSMFSLSARGGDDLPASEVAWSAQHPEPNPQQLVRLTPDSTPKSTAEMSQQQKIAAALLKAGISSPAAWAAAGVSPTGQTGAVQTIADPATMGGNGDHAQNGAFDAHPAVVLMRGRNNKTFLISWRSQQEVARSLGWKCALMIWGGPALALLSLYFFLNVEHLR
jgi:hypothetical protein